ncbi:MAG TPA: glycosyltransferase family 2 protein, partial [Desulfatiglandales bacterium]|nr:glycosyltransferase family 2 protein [Desulfatiglandales bacterium]
MNRSDISIIIPAYNESATIGDIIRKIKSLYPEPEVIVINDGSSDDTVSSAKDAGAIVYSHPYNIGNGAAIKSGIRIASGEILVFMDGDGQHNPEDIDRMLEFFPEYEMVVGARS